MINRFRLAYRQARTDQRALRALTTAAGGRSHAHALLAAATTYVQRGGTAAALGALALRTTPGAPAPTPEEDTVPDGNVTLDLTGNGRGTVSLWLRQECGEHADRHIDDILAQIGELGGNITTRTGAPWIVATIDDQDGGWASIKVRAPIRQH